MVAIDGTGGRRISAERAHWSRVAEAAEIGRHTRQEIRSIVAAAAPALGLRAPAMLLLRELLDMSAEGDWQAGRRPLVWPSNAYLAARLACSVSAARRQLATLADAGLITYRDSGNFKRFGRRDREGTGEAFGIDLSILTARADELHDLAQAQARARQHERSLRHRITAARRAIRASIDVATASRMAGRWMTFGRRLAAILLAHGGTIAGAPLHFLERMASALERLRAAVEKALSGAVQVSKMTTSLATSEQHIEHYNHPFSVDGNDDRHRASARSADCLGAGIAGAIASGEAKGEAEAEIFDVEQVVRACPTLQDFAPRQIATWADLIEAADHLPRLVGISPQAWQEARDRMGYARAAVAVAVVAEKSTRSMVSSAGGYLRGMTRKAVAGQLRLGATLRGLASSHQ